MRLSTLLSAAALLAAAPGTHARSIGGRPGSLILDEKRDALQSIVTWDQHSLFIRGERVMIFSGEFHPFRLPVPSLYVDVFQKIRAMGYNTVSFYVDWNLLEGKPGNFSAEGIFALEPFFDAAMQAGIYLLARPGPYINAEASGGGFPGWLQRVKGILRSSAADYMASTDNYMENICKIIAKAQITNGGPVILFQPENEYTQTGSNTPYDNSYMQKVIDQVRSHGIVVPLINNDAWNAGHDAPGTGTGAVDIYGHDGYPVGFDCANPYTWPSGGLPTNYYSSHVSQSPKTPFSLVEFQGGSFDPWGGWGFEQCSILVNNEFERVFYKNNMAAGVTIFNIYMTYGGTNWGNLGHPGGYTSYDYGSVIREDRRVDREKYSEAKLEAQFLKVSTGYMLTTASNPVTGKYSSNTGITVTALLGNGTGSFFVVRHSDYRDTSAAAYTLSLPTSAGTLSIPQLGGSLSLNGRDSKIHVTDYPVGNITLLYSTAEVFTWKQFEDKKVLVIYGGLGETHELAIKTSSTPTVIAGQNITSSPINGAAVFKWSVASERTIVKVDDMYIYMLDRNSAYNYWVPAFPGTGAYAAFGKTLMNPEGVIINGGYLIRSAAVDGPTLRIKGDFNQTATLEIIGVPKGVSKVSLNGAEIAAAPNALGNWVVEVAVPMMKLKVRDIAQLNWKSIDSLPEIQAGYDDSAWVAADHKYTNNSANPLSTPTSLYGGDYGFNNGPLLFRGSFIANGTEKSLQITTSGGSAFGSSVWLNGTFVGSFIGYDAANKNSATYSLPNLTKGQAYVLTVVVDHNGLDENWIPGNEEMKHPRGILAYGLVATDGSVSTAVSWKMTGNLGGEDFRDRVRGPLNEGGLFFERQGYHQPSPPLEKFTTGSPLDGVTKPGVTFYAAPLTLDYDSSKFDIPISFTFDNSTATGAYRAQLYVNGFQFGKYVSNVGPQKDFPVPEGILNYKGENWIGLAVWALQAQGAKIPGFSMTVKTPVLTGREPVSLVEAPRYAPRAGAY